MTKKLLSLGLVFFILFFSSYNVLGKDQSQNSTTNPTRETESSSPSDKASLEKKIRDLERKLDETLKQKNTLSSQIEYMNTQIYLTELQIQQTEIKIEKIKQGIDTLDARIEKLDSSLEDESRKLLDRIATFYKQRNVSLVEYLLDSQNANDFFEIVKYQKIAQENNQKRLIQFQQSKSNFEEQKKAREREEKKLAASQETLRLQQTELTRQQKSKEQLLAETQNNEATYRRLIAEAERKIASFESFVVNSGVNIISAGALGTGEGGWYLSQRDERWAGVTIGTSSKTIYSVGCFITSIAMVFRFYGYDITPATLANDISLFIPGQAWAYKPSLFNGTWPGGKNYKNISAGEVPSYLSRGIPVIAEVKPVALDDMHYIVLKKIDGDSYIMNDPIYGPDKKVSDYYTFRGIYGVFE
jgi:peptidoglycan hydrolase CwlO-like protein